MEIANILCLRLFDQVFDEYEWVEVRRTSHLELCSGQEEGEEVLIKTHVLVYDTDSVVLNGHRYVNPEINVKRLNTDNHIEVTLIHDDNQVYRGVYNLPPGTFQSVDR